MQDPLNTDYLLSLGTVVKLKDSNGDYLIIGRGVLGADKNMYDYCAVACPFGFSSPDQMIMFSTETIDEVVHQGYSTKADEKLGKLTYDFINKEITPEEYFSGIDEMTKTQEADLGGE